MENGTYSGTVQVNCRFHCREYVCVKIMLNAYKDIIISNLSDLVDHTNLNTLVPELLERNVLKSRMICKILNPSHPARRQKTDLYIQILQSGPEAFEELIDSLSVTNHSQLANILRIMADNQPSSDILPSPIISSSSERLTSTNYEPDGPCMSSLKEYFQNAQIDDPKKQNESSGLLKSFPINCCSQSESSNIVSNDLRDSSASVSDDKIFALPNYLTPLKALQAIGIDSSEFIVNFQTEANLPVKVVKSKDWPVVDTGKPLCYKMDSNPRGCLLLINNINFDDEESYPERKGADNDQTRVIELFKQFHFDVEDHKNKTKTEMESIISTFSKNEKFYVVDCICLIIMSHGQEGDSKEDSEVMGTDGLGFKVLDIVTYFDNDACPAAVNKPKLFFIQACRGCLADVGVTLYQGIISNRTETDGKKVNKLVTFKIRSKSDIFIACPVPPGITANRDKFTGTWFIQTIIEVFSAHAWNTHLEDLMKMVDQRIKKMNNLHNSNFQSLTTKTIGWDRNLFFNPGLYKDQSGNTVRIGGETDTDNLDEGMDVVDSCQPKPSKSKIRNDYSRLKDNDGRTPWCCLN